MEKKTQAQKMEGIEKERDFDVIIFAASGFTGKYIVREALKFLNPSSSPMKTLALAGRNKSKVSQALKWASGSAEPPPLPILYADVSDPASLLAVCRRAKVVLNCVGPFTLYGEPVVAACVESGTHYLDICSEPAFMDRTEVLYHEKAKKSGSLVLSACAHGSILSEVGFLFHTQQWVFPAVVNNVDAYLCLYNNKRIVGNIGTLESASLGVGRQLQEFTPVRATPKIPGPPAPSLVSIEHKKAIDLWAVRLPSNDPIVIRKTLSLLTENPKGLPGVNEKEEDIDKREKFWATVKPAHFGVNLCTTSFLGMIRYILIGILMGLFGLFSFGRWLLLQFPEILTLGLFRKTGPTDEEVKSASFKKWLIGRGYSDYRLAGNKKPDMEIITRISGSDIGYIGSSIIIIQCALILLGQRRKFPKGGVFPPGILFGPTDLQERLQQNGISFDVVSVNGRPA